MNRRAREEGGGIAPQGDMRDRGELAASAALERWIRVSIARAVLEEGGDDAGLRRQVVAALEELGCGIQADGSAEATAA